MPILDLLVPDRGVTLLLRGVVWDSVLPGDLDLTKGSLRAVNDGEATGVVVVTLLVVMVEVPASLGVTAVLPLRKLEERAGVSGLEVVVDLECLSEGMVGKGERVDEDWRDCWGGSSRITATVS